MPSRLFIGFLCLLIPLSAANTDPAADEAVVQSHLVHQLAPLVLETVLVKDGAADALLVPGDGPTWQMAAAHLQSVIKTATGVVLPIRAPAKLTEQDWAQHTVVVLGNLEENPVYARLYNNFFVCADAAYTGRGGYELRTVHDPWGLGHNAIAVGAQDAAGLDAGVERLAAEITAHAASGQLTLGRLLLLQLNPEDRRAPLQAHLSADAIAKGKAAIDRTAATAGEGRAAAYETVKYAMNYHLTGDEGWFELFRYALVRQLDYYETDEYITHDGPRRYDRDFRDSWGYRMIIAWDLLEEHPGWTEAERLRITNHMLRLVFESNMKNGWDSPEAIARWLKYSSILNNHQTWPSMSNLFGGWYFTRHYHLPIARTWLDMATRMYHSASHSAKPWEDASGYDWVVPRHLLVYALASGDRTYIDEGHAALTGRSLLMSLDPLAHQPSWGDNEQVDGFFEMPELLCAMEYVLNDGRFRWAIDRLGVDARGEMEQPYWTNCPAKRPDDLNGISVSYLPRRHYDLLGNLAREPVDFRAPNIPFEDTFSKIVSRTGWGSDDDYLMLDGYAAGWHSHFDGNGIVSFISGGANWLVGGEPYRKTTKYVSAVTVERGGVSEVMPTNARLDVAAWFDGGALTRTTMPHYNGMTWTRNIVHVAKRYVAVIDELTAEQAGDYSLRCIWRVFGDATLRGDELEVRQGEHGFTLKNLSGDNQELIFVRNSGIRNYTRGAGMDIHQLYQRTARHFNAGETVRFVNIFAAAADHVPALDAWLTGDGHGAVTLDGHTELFGVNGLDGSITTDAPLYRIAADTAWLANARRLAVGSTTYLEAPAATIARLDANGLALGASQPVPETGLHPATIVGPSKPGSPHFDAVSTLAKLIRPKTPAGTAPPESHDESTATVQWKFDAFTKGAGPKTQLTQLASADLDGDGRADVLVGTGAGDIVAVSSDGRELWRKRADASITALAAGRLAPDGELFVFYGTDAATFGVLTREGHDVSHVIPPEYRTVPSRARNITLADIDRDGVAEIVIGCDSFQYMAYKLPTVAGGSGRELKLDWKCVFYAHAATVCHVADLDGDGYPEIIAGNNYYSLQILSHDGKVIAGNSTFGPEQTAANSVPIPGSAQRMLVVGNDAGDVVALNAEAKRLWSMNIGDRVTTLLSEGSAEKPLIIAAGEGGYVRAFDLAGKVVWERNLGRPVKRLVQDKDGYVGVTNHEVFRLAPDGRLVSSAVTPSAPVDIVTQGGVAFVRFVDDSIAAMTGR